MPRLAQVVPPDLPSGCFEGSAAFALRDVEVLAVRLATGAPCSGHADLFAPWPGPESDVHQWFVLANGKAVGIGETSSVGCRILVRDLEEVQQ
jgi:hypothetical protein